MSYKEDMNVYYQIINDTTLNEDQKNQQLIEEIRKREVCFEKKKILKLLNKIERKTGFSMDQEKLFIEITKL